jgi:ligand-binding sensor domain-containing protein/signal transduction histidine kinase
LGLNIPLKVLILEEQSFTLQVRSKLILIVSLLFLTSADIVETGNNIRFQRITISEGLSLSSVYCIFQDSKGFMWFGTEDGLNKYDGKNFKVYRPVPSDKNSLTYRWIEHILEDNSGNLWFGSRNGLSYFNPRKELFVQYIHDPDILTSISNDTITKLFLDNNNFIWIGTLNGLNRINIGTRELEKIQLTADENVNLRIYDLLTNKKGNIWIATSNGLFRYDPTAQSYERVILNIPGKQTEKILSVVENNDVLWIGTEAGLIRYSIPDEKLSCYTIPGGRSYDQTVEKVYMDKSGNLWIVSSQGLLRFDQHADKFIHIIKSLDTSHSLSINTVKPIFEDSNGLIWFGTFGSGLYRIQPETGIISHFQNNPADQKSLSENSINCIYEDHCGRLFFGTFGAGISIYDPQANKFPLLRHNPLDHNSLSSNFVWSVFEDHKGHIWIGTNDKGLNVFYPETGQFVFYDHNESDPYSLPNSSVREINEDSKGNIWIGTDGGGLSKFDPNSGKFISFHSVPENPGTISNNSVRNIYEDRDGILWIGTKEGLNRFDPETGIFKRYLHSSKDPQSISSNFIYSRVYQDKKGFLWIGTYGGGLNKMNIEDETFTRFLNDPDNPESISDNVVFSIYQDDTGKFWIGTNNGLDLFDAESGKFRRFGLNEGLPNEVIYGILPDKNNNIWMSTNHGISRFNIIDYSTKNFDVNDGLQSNEFNGGAFHKGHSGRMYFGGVYGLNIIEPEEIKVPSCVSDVVITKLEILGHEVKVLPPSLTREHYRRSYNIIEIDGNYFLPENISFVKEIVLDYRYRFFSVEFSALNNPVPGRIMYSYQMENLEDNWNYSGERNYISYANMKPGGYVLNVRALNPDGNWSDKIGRLNIVIKPPFWLSWWFIILEVLFGLMVAVFIYRYLVKVRTYNLLRLQHQRVNAANIKLAESERNLKEINATKDKFFSIIAHDLKNPLTSLISISETIMEESLDGQDDKSFGIRKIHESVKQIHALLENLLTWSRSQTGRLKYEPVNFNLSRLIEVNLNLHRAMAEYKNVKLEFEQKDNIIAFGDRDMINTVIRNLVNNAVKFTSPGGLVKVEVKQDNNIIQVFVIDNGTGISEENMQKLFKIDVKYKTPGTSGEKGTGLGLILCKEFVEKNGGQMIVRSILNQGSTFGFTVPAGRKEE